MLLFYSRQLLHQRPPGVFHFRYGKTFLPRIIQRGPDMVHRLPVQNQEAVVKNVGVLHFQLRVLPVKCRHIPGRKFCFSKCINCYRNAGILFR